MNFNLFVSLLVNGLAMGMVYALLAMGLIMLFRSAGVMNFAQGMMLAVGAYISYATQVQADLPLYAAIPLCLASYVVFGLIFMACIYLPLKDTKFPAAIVVATMGTSSIPVSYTHLDGQPQLGGEGERADVVLISTSSRSLSREQAYFRVAEATQALRCLLYTSEYPAPRPDPGMELSDDGARGRVDHLLPLARLPVRH